MQQEVVEQTIIFTEEINNDSVQSVITQMSSYPFVNLYFSTVGGEIYAMTILCDYLNRRYEQNSIRVYLGPIVLSAGTYLLIYYRGPLFMTRHFKCFMFHAPDISLFTIRATKHEKRIKQYLDEDNELYYNSLLGIGLTKSDIKKIKEGDDVYVFRDELDKLNINFYTEDETIVTTNYYKYIPPNKKE